MNISERDKIMIRSQHIYIYILFFFKARNRAIKKTTQKEMWSTSLWCVLLWAWKGYVFSHYHDEVIIDGSKGDITDILWGMKELLAVGGTTSKRNEVAFNKIQQRDRGETYICSGVCEFLIEVYISTASKVKLLHLYIALDDLDAYFITSFFFWTTMFTSLLQDYT